MMTEADVQAVLKSPCTHRLVFEAIELAENFDIVDAIYDLRTAADILAHREKVHVDQLESAIKDIDKPQEQIK